MVATLVNGVFGDPLLHVRIADHKRSMLIDMGEGARIPARTAHQVTDVFLSHAHIDHIAGFLSFLRSRIGERPPCRVFGPAGIADNVAGLVAGVHWDRVGPRAPRFEVTEFDGDRLRRFSVIAGGSNHELVGESPADEVGTVFRDGLMRVEAAVLDHMTPVLAFAIATHATIHVRKERLNATGLQPGPWLTQLKDCLAAGDRDACILLPSGDESSVAELADELLLEAPGRKLAYATDFADTAGNRAAICKLAQGAHTFFCEAAFCEIDSYQARRTGHLTTRACGEIATAAGVQQLIPFHFSRRYESTPLKVYDEVRSACAATLVPDLDRSNIIWKHDETFRFR